MMTSNISARADDVIAGVWRDVDVEDQEQLGDQLGRGRLHDPGQGPRPLRGGRPLHSPRVCRHNILTRHVPRVTDYHCVLYSIIAWIWGLTSIHFVIFIDNYKTRQSRRCRAISKQAHLIFHCDTVQFLVRPYWPLLMNQSWLNMLYIVVCNCIKFWTWIKSFKTDCYS